MRDFPARVTAALRKVSPPPPLVAVWRRTTSTNEAAKAAAGDGAGERAAGSVFLAESQTAGRGRYGRAWVSPPGGLYLSLVVAGGATTLLPIAAGLAVALAVRRAAGAPAVIRWPNDLDLAGRKVAGVLAETGFLRERPELAVVGFGVNLGPVEASPSPGWLPVGASRVELASALVAAFRETSALDPARLRERWEALSPTARGCRCEVSFADRDGVVGSTDGLAPGGGLRVRLEDGTGTVIHVSDAIRIRHEA